jgi:two-component system chemotaxis response regulator CheB
MKHDISERATTLEPRAAERIETRATEPIIAIGSSTDGFKAIGEILEALPARFPGAVVVVQHRARGGPALLAGLLKLRTPLEVKDATDGEQIRPGVVYLAPPNRHLMMQDGRLRLSDAPRVNFARPSVDVLFESVASVCGKRAIAVILSGGGKDGAHGLQAIRRAGGRTIVQAPAGARKPGMPMAALAADGADLILDLADIGPRIVEFLKSPVPCPTTYS